MHKTVVHSFVSIGGVRCARIVSGNQMATGVASCLSNPKQVRPQACSGVRSPPLSLCHICHAHLAVLALRSETLSIL